MSFDRKEFSTLAAKRASEREAQRLPNLRAIAAITPRMEQLTRDERWDTYCGYLAGIVDKLEAAKLSARTRLEDPMLVSDDDVRRHKHALLINDAMIQALNLAMDLPKVLIESAERASVLIAEFERAHALESDAA